MCTVYILYNFFFVFICNFKFDVLFFLNGNWIILHEFRRLKIFRSTGCLQQFSIHLEKCFVFFLLAALVVSLNRNETIMWFCGCRQVVDLAKGNY